MIHSNNAVVFMQRLGESLGVKRATIPEFRAGRNWERAEIARNAWIHSSVGQTGGRIACQADRLSTGQHTIAKILVGNDCRYRYSERLPQALVVAKKECLILFDRPPEGAAELVSTKRKHSR